MEILRVAEWTVEVGGEEPSGWLPSGAARPLPTPRRRTEVSLAILTEGEPGGGFILEWREPSGLAGDTWHASIDEALERAEAWFGLPADAWTSRR